MLGAKFGDNPLARAPKLIQCYNNKTWKLDEPGKYIIKSGY